MHKAQAQGENVFILQNSRKVYLGIRQAAEFQGAFPPEGPHTPHHVTVNLEGALGTQPRARIQDAGRVALRWEALHRCDREKRGLHVRRRRGRKIHALTFHSV